MKPTTTKTTPAMLRVERFCKNYLNSTTQFHAYWSRQIIEKIEKRSIDCGILKIDFLVSQNDIDKYIEKMEKLKYFHQNKSIVENEKKMNEKEEKTNNNENENKENTNNGSNNKNSEFNLQNLTIEKRYAYILLYLILKSYCVIPLSNSNANQESHSYHVFNDDQTDAALMNEIIQKYHFMYYGQFKEEFNSIMKKVNDFSKIEWKDEKNELRKGVFVILKEWTQVYEYLSSFFKNTYSRERKYNNDEELVKILTQIEKWFNSQETMNIDDLQIEYWYIFIVQYNDQFYLHVFAMISEQYFIALRLLLMPQ